MTVIRRIATTLFRQVDIASLVFFRIAFGVVMLWEVVRYFEADWIRRYWIEPAFHFTFPLFDWVRPWPGDGMILHFYLLGILALFIAIGFLYRLSATLFFLAFTYVFLLDQARYLNHFYLIALMSFLLIFVPAHRAASIDALIRPKLRSLTMPLWAVALLAGQMGVVYFFGGLAKLNRDWLRGEPMRSWLAERTDFPLIGSLFTEEWMVYLSSYGGLLLDLLAVPLLLWRRTRGVTFALLILFHLMNEQLFTIGIFPWFAIAATTLFFPPDWPRRLWEDARKWGRASRRGSFAWAGALAGALIAVWSTDELAIVPLAIGAVSGALLLWTMTSSLDPAAHGRVAAPIRSLGAAAATGSNPGGTGNPGPTIATLERGQILTLALLSVWFSVQISVPLRHYFIPGYVSWTEEGHNFSWHMKLRDKDRESVTFFASDPATGESWFVDAGEKLESWQYSKMAGRPHMICQFARHLSQTLAAEGRPGVEIRVLAVASLNGREPQRLIDPNVDLAHAPIRLGHAPWILPLTEPLRRN